MPRLPLMRTSFRLAILGLLMVACSAMRLVSVGATSTPTADGAAWVAPTASAADMPPADSLTPVPVHVGSGIRGSWFEIYFTDPSNPASAQHTGGLDERLVLAIDSARLSVHTAIYSITLNDVRDALIRAHRRGVDVLVVTESDNIEGEDLRRLRDAGIPVLGDRRESTMHNKFMVIDGLDVWTGSMNFTVSGTYEDDNTLVRLSSAALAADFEAEFVEMFKDDKFGDDPGRNTPNGHLDIEGTAVEVYFSPDDGVEPELANLLDRAEESIYFLAYSFTSDRLGGSLRRAERAGLTVRGVLDEDQASSNAGSELPALRAADIDVRLDGNPGQMHHKAMIIDQKIVVLGSYNFTRSASESNDENVVVIHSPAIAQLFMHEFQRVYAISQP